MSLSLKMVLNEKEEDEEDDVHDVHDLDRSGAGPISSPIHKSYCKKIIIFF